MASRASVPSPEAVEPGIRLTGCAQLKLVHFPVSHSSCMSDRVRVISLGVAAFETGTAADTVSALGKGEMRVPFRRSR